MVPDGAAFEADTAKPTPPEEEADADLLRRVWEQASKGTPADLCEASAATAAYRIGRMYAHWLEEKELRPKAPR